MIFKSNAEITWRGFILWSRRTVWLAFVAFAFMSLAGWTRGSAQRNDNRAPVKTPSSLPQLRLGERLFKDPRFSTTKGDFPASCSTCHLFTEDPQGLRAYADFLNRSWFSYRFGDPRRNELRNSPALYDVGQMPRLHFDGEFASLEDLVKGTFAGRPMGWLPGEQPQAYAQIQAVVLADKGDESGAGAYRDQFRAASGLELDKLSRDELVNQVAQAVADFMRSLNSPMNSPYDQFIKLNKLEAAPAAAESSPAFAAKLLAKVVALEKAGSLKLPTGFETAALDGFKIFFRVEGATAVGNCVACHAPPLFTDYSYHNLGISQVEYDQMHGAGKFAVLSIPDAATAVRPAAQFRETPTRARPGEVDLGYWNFADLKKSPWRRAEENDTQFLRRLIGTFKTPGLRHLAYSYPYMHTGAYGSLEDTLAEIMRLSEMARAGEVRAADEELKRISISEAQIVPLVAFLKTLSEDLKRRY